jgi:hypothetical protein
MPDGVPVTPRRSRLFRAIFIRRNEEHPLTTARGRGSRQHIYILKGKPRCL